jgi:hypothetical protein
MDLNLNKIRQLLRIRRKKGEAPDHAKAQAITDVPPVYQITSESNSKQTSTKYLGATIDKPDVMFGGFMTEEEVAKDQREGDLGWREIYDRIRKL